MSEDPAGYAVVPDDAPKPWWQSRAIVGALVVVGAQVVRSFGWEIDSQAMTDAILGALTLIGAALAWWGRVHASCPISRRVAPGVGSDRPLSGLLRQPAALPADTRRPAPGSAPGPFDHHSD